MVYKNTTRQKYFVHLKTKHLEKVESKHKEEMVEDLKHIVDLDLGNDVLSKAFLPINGEKNITSWKFKL